MAAIGIVAMAESAIHKISLGYARGEFNRRIFSGFGHRLFRETSIAVTCVAFVCDHRFSGWVNDVFDLFSGSGGLALVWRHFAGASVALAHLVGPFALTALGLATYRATAS